MLHQNKQSDSTKEIIGLFIRSFTPGTYAEEKDASGLIKNRKIRATFVTESPTVVYDRSEEAVIREILPMWAMQMPVNGQLPLLDDHNRSNAGSIKGSGRELIINGDHADASIYFARSSGDIADLAQDGHLTDLSVGYQIDPFRTTWIPPGARTIVGGKEYDNSNSSMRCAVRTWWMPFEISITPIGADARSKFRDFLSNNNLNKTEEGIMSIPVETVPEGQRAAPPVQMPVDAEQIRRDAVKAALAVDKERRSDIEATAKDLGIEVDFYRSFLDNTDCTVARAREALIIEAQKRLRVVPTGGDPSGIVIGNDETDKFRAIAEDCICIRNSLPDKRFDPDRLKLARSSDLRNLDGTQALAKECLNRAGVKGVHRMSAREITDMILSPNSGHYGTRASVAQASGDFANVLANVQNKFFMNGYQDAPTTFQRWVGKQSLNDFKRATLFNISKYSDIKWTPESKNPQWGRFSDKAEYVTLFKYESAYSLSFEAIVNDDKSAFSFAPAAMGSAVARKKDRETYHYLVYGTTEPTGDATTTSVGPTMNEDSTAMFTSTHGNLVTGAAPSISSYNTAQSALAKIKLLAPDGESKTIYSQAPVKFLLCATEKRAFWMQILGSPTSKDYIDGSVTANANANIINPFQGEAEVISTPYLSEIDSGYPWYVLADPSVMGHIVLATLAGEEAPQLRSAPSEIGQARGLVWDIMAIYALGASDWRGIVRNPGH
jgi:hypothetical protein